MTTNDRKSNMQQEHDDYNSAWNDNASGQSAGAAPAQTQASEQTQAADQSQQTDQGQAK